MAKWEERILSSAEKISKGIEKGADYINSLNKTTTAQIRLQRFNQGTDQTVKHCPSCGYAISSLNMTCPACGVSLEDASGSSTAQILAYNLAVIENQKESLIRNLIRNHQGNISDKALQKAQMIKTCPIPNTKKDIFEILSMAASCINAKILLGISDSTLDADAVRSERLLSETWLEKMEAIYLKAKMLFSEEPDFSKIENIYLTKKAEIDDLKKSLEKKKKNGNSRNIAIAFALVLLAATVYYFAVYKPHERKVLELEAIVAEIRQDINNRNYNEALLKTNKLRFKEGGSNEEEVMWDQTREKIIHEIEELIKGN